MSLNLSLVQFNPDFGNISANISRIKNYCATIESDIIVFPELCTTGYFFQNKTETLKLAENSNGSTINSIQQIATKKNSIIIFGFIEEDQGKVYNSAVIVMPDKSKSRIYRKTHLFYKERFCFDAGDSGFFVIEDKEKDIRIGTMICYDWRFPEAARSLGLLGADLIVCPSNLVTNIWTKVMPARAIENKVYLAVANRIGSESYEDEVVSFNGLSGIWSYNGDLLAGCPSDEEWVITTAIDPSKTRDKSFNAFNNIVADRRPEMYILHKNN